MSRQPRFWLLLLLPGILLLVALPVGAQAVLGGLEGVVLGFDGKPLVGATIEIERTDIKARYEVKTDRKGYYLHAALPSGMQTRFTIRVIDNGQKLHEIKGFNILANERARLDIDLQKARKQQEQGLGLTAEQKQQQEELRKKQEATKNTEQHFNLGRELMGQKKYAEAAAEFETAAQLDPTQWVIYANLGQAYAAANQYEKAMQAYQKAVELDPQQAAAHNGLGQVYVKLGHTEDARKEFETAAQLSPENAAAFYYNLGVTFYNSGDLKSAIEPFRKATELDPNRAEAFYLLGVCLYNSAEYKTEGGEMKTILLPGTRESFERYLALEPNGRYANDAKAMLQAMEATVPTSVRMKKK